MNISETFKSLDQDGARVLHPALLIGRSSAHVQLILVGQYDHATAAVVRITLANGKDPSPFDIQSGNSIQWDVLCGSAADMAVTASVRFTEVEAVHISGIRHD